MAARLPTVVVPVFNAVGGLDACLAALEATLPAGSRVYLADDASSDPHVAPMVSGWWQRSQLETRYVRQPSRVGFAANCAAAFRECAGDDLVLLDSQSIPSTPGWLQRLQQCAEAHPRSATLATWSNRAGLCTFPLFGEDNPLPAAADGMAFAEAAASMAGADSPELPAVDAPCLFLRGVALRQLGGLDDRSFSGARVLDDLARRALAMGWSNRLCADVHMPCATTTASAGVEAPLHPDQEALLSRWPDFQELSAMFILSDPLRGLRERLQARIGELARGGPQRDLFD